jgi:hypothetical protein
MSESAPEERLDIREAVAAPVADADGTVVGPDKAVSIHVIRPGIGKGKGRHLYEAAMLERNADKFAGWKMYVDHLSSEAQKAAGGLPRKVRELGGRVLESRWDGSVPPDPERGYGQGAVVARVRPVKWLREMIEDDPELIETSISAHATGVRPVTRNGQKVWLVEGIADKGSVDWVTEAGAGGRVAPLLEAAFASEEDIEMALLESMTDDEVTGWLREERPHIALAEADTDPDPIPDPEDTERAGERVEEAAAAAASRNDDPEGGDDDMTITPEALREALESEEGRSLLDGLVEARLESKLEEERDLIRAEARADAQREVQLTKLELQAHRLIEASGLPDKWRESVREQFRLSEAGEPTPSLDVLDEIDEYGNVLKTAQAQLEESVLAELGRQRELLAAANPTRVRGQGPARPASGGDAEKQRKPSETGWGRFLQESVGVDPDRAFAINGAGGDTTGKEEEE